MNNISRKDFLGTLAFGITSLLVVPSTINTAFKEMLVMPKYKTSTKLEVSDKMFYWTKEDLIPINFVVCNIENEKDEVMLITYRLKENQAHYNFIADRITINEDDYSKKMEFKKELYPSVEGNNFLEKGKTEFHHIYNTVIDVPIIYLLVEKYGEKNYYTYSEINNLIEETKQDMKEEPKKYIKTINA